MSLYIIKNADKDSGWMESWTKDRPIGRFPHSFRLLTAGPCGHGKTNFIKNVFLEHQKATKREDRFQRLYIMVCSNDEGEITAEWDDMDADLVTHNMLPSDLFDEGVKTMVIIDDYELAHLTKLQEKKLRSLFRNTSTHKNVSIICSYQSFFDTPGFIREFCNVFTIWKPSSKQKLSTISNRVGVSTKFIRAFFKKNNDPHDSLTIDLTKGTPYKVRLNLHEHIPYDSDSDDD